MKRSSTYYIRKTHRYLGLFIGIQLLFWTISGLFFTWSDMDEIHGDTYRNSATFMKVDTALVSPSVIISAINEKTVIDSVISVELFELFEEPFYRLKYFSKSIKETVLAQAHTGVIKSELTKDDAAKLAKEAFAPMSEIESINYLTDTDVHHEYRNRDLPAWAIRFKHYSNTMVYVSAKNAKVERFRNRNWRIFDFLWMVHTMDYQTRDHIGNWVLRIFSVLGVITVLSGFVYFVVTSKTLQGRRK